MENILNRPKAILFARVDKEEHLQYLNNRQTMLIRYAREHGYYIMYGTYSVTKVKEVEEKFLPFIPETLIPSLE